MAVVAPDVVSKQDNVTRYEWHDYTANAGGTDTFEMNVPEYSMIVYMDSGPGVDFNAGVQVWWQMIKGATTQNTACRLDWSRNTVGASGTDKQNDLGTVSDATAGVGGYATATMSGNANFHCPPGQIEVRVNATAGSRAIMVFHIIPKP